VVAIGVIKPVMAHGSLLHTHHEQSLYSMLRGTAVSVSWIDGDLNTPDESLSTEQDRAGGGGHAVTGGGGGESL